MRFSSCSNFFCLMLFPFVHKSQSIRNKLIGCEMHKFTRMLCARAHHRHGDRLMVFNISHTSLHKFRESSRTCKLSLVLHFIKMNGWKFILLNIHNRRHFDIWACAMLCIMMWCPNAHSNNADADANANALLLCAAAAAAILMTLYWFVAVIRFYFSHRRQFGIDFCCVHQFHENIYFNRITVQFQINLHSETFWYVSPLI